MSPDILATELFMLIEQAILDQPRSQQRRIGPSELGVPCDRRVGYRIAGIEPAAHRGAAWKPWVGTAMHEQVATVMASHEVSRMQSQDYQERYKVEERVSVGEVDGIEIIGSCDLFDVQHGAVWDWKFVTRNKIREQYRPHGPGEQYRVQAHLYGRGWQRQGHDVRSVGVIFMTRDGDLADRHVWHEPYDEQVAIDALDRASGIAIAIEALGPQFTLPTLQTAEAHCRFCPWFRDGATDIAQACPGHPQQRNNATIAQLIGA